ncbi:ferric reductase-like transmembrane domain-containing protein [Cellulomonas sp.]|uniref:ferredoxin reductase family protein n=1 Tax=Cellulomonas sp. TaxID=40001 RepID=UPI001B062A7A|nr:ferric reductase-like transmembrane domain-containing protein [Cellulomonas sp.]MBO9553675.1 ferric reductase-like transmembrane domain-containing protein [Cellulomonas sp.]
MSTRHGPGDAARLKVLILLGALVAAWPVRASAVPGGGIDGAVLVAHLSGMLAGYGSVVLVALMSRWPVIEQAVGVDELARWHARGGRLVMALIATHACAAVVVWAGLRGLDAGSATTEVLRMPGVAAAVVAVGLLVLVAVTSARRARRRIRYETWHGIHLLTYVAIAAAFVHQLAGPDLAGRRVVQVGWSLLYAGAFALVVRHRVLKPVHAAVRHRMRVASVVTEAAGTVSITVHGRRLDELDAQPGQYFRWRFLTPHTWRRAHPFSLSAPPQHDTLRLTVAARGDTTRALQAISPGVRVVADGPYGILTERRRTRRDVVLIAGGIGIAPMRALFETLHIPSGGDVLLLYRTTDASRALLADELDRLADRAGARLHYLTQPGGGELTAPSLLRRVPDLVRRDVFVCGPPVMTRTLMTDLTRAGLPRAQLHAEGYQTVH